MKNCVKQAYAMSAMGALTSGGDSENVGGTRLGLETNELETLRDLKKTDYFDRV